MLLLVTTGHPDMERYASPCLGRLVQPRHYSSVAKTANEGYTWAADNDAFGNFDADAYRAMLDAIRGLPGCKFVTAPDIVADDIGTMARFWEWRDELGDLPVGLVAQDGLTPGRVPWDEIEALFIGGSTAFKLSTDVRWLVQHAKDHGKWVHMGRVNSLKRLRYAESIGCDSVDGTQWSRFKKQYLAWGLEALEHGEPLSSGRRLG